MAIDLPLGWMRQIIDASPNRFQAAQRPPRCCGTFWDAQRGRSVSIDLGRVNLTVPFVFRAAPSAGFIDDEPENLLSWAEEGAAQSTEYPTNEEGNYPVRVLCNTRTNCNGLQSEHKKHPRTNSHQWEFSC